MNSLELVNDFSFVSKTKGSVPKGGNVIDGIYEDAGKNDVSVQDFLDLMIQQLKNQDFMNPMDDSQYLTQMAQFATMQQMQDLAYYSKSNYAMSLAGKDVTVARLGIGGNVEKFTGPVEKISYINNEYKIYVKGQAFSLNQIMDVNGISSNNSNSSSSENTIGKMSVSLKNKTKNSFDVSWPTPNIDGLDAGKYEYTVYYSKNSSFDTLEDVKKNGVISGTEGMKNVNSITINGLEPDTTYFVNVIVKDETGKESIFMKGVTTTSKDGSN